jgi:hypothetical protein
MPRNPCRRLSPTSCLRISMRFLVYAVKHPGALERYIHAHRPAEENTTDVPQVWKSPGWDCNPTYDSISITRKPLERSYPTFPSTCLARARSRASEIAPCSPMITASEEAPVRLRIAALRAVRAISASLRFGVLSGMDDCLDLSCGPLHLLCNQPLHLSQIAGYLHRLMHWREHVLQTGSTGQILPGARWSPDQCHLYGP